MHENFHEVYHLSDYLLLKLHYEVNNSKRSNLLTIESIWGDPLLGIGTLSTADLKIYLRIIRINDFWAIFTIYL